MVNIVRNAVIVCLASWSLWAQGEVVNARLAGTVLDQNQGAVADARVTLSNPATGFSRKLITATDGRYVFTSIPPGLYQLKVEKPGFNTYLHSGVALTVGQSTSVDPLLEVGAISQTIEVTAGAPVLNTGNANIGAEVSGTQVVDLPLNLRNVFNLVLLSSSVNNSTQTQGLT